MRRVDPDGRTIGRFFADEVAGRLGIEFYIGVPASVASDRIATFVGGRRLAMALHAHEVPWPVFRRMMNPRSMTFKAFTNPKAITKLPDINTRKLLEVELPSVNGTGTARSPAEVYGDLAAGGARLGISAATLQELERPKASGTFNQFYDACHILTAADPATQRSWLALVALTQRCSSTRSTYSPSKSPTACSQIAQTVARSKTLRAFSAATIRFLPETIDGPLSAQSHESSSRAVESGERRVDGLFDEHCDRHRPDATRNGRDETCMLDRFVLGHVADVAFVVAGIDHD